MTAVSIPLGSWQPDLPLLGNEGVSRAFNVLPGNGAYLPMNSASLFSSTTSSSTPLGATSGLDPSGNAMVFMGDASTLYQLDPNTKSWSDISRTGAYSTAEGERWRFAEFGRLQVAINYNDRLQAFDKQTSTKFADLTTLVRARYVMALDNFLVVANTFDALDGAQSGRVRWSGIGDAGIWTYSPDSMSDFQDILGYGKITGLAAMGEDGIILLENAIFRMTFVGGPGIFEFKPIILGKGCTVPNSVIVVEGKVFFLSGDGFYMLDGASLTPIGEGKVNTTFLANANGTDSFGRMSVEADPNGKNVYWLYTSVNSVSAQPDRYMIFNYATARWSEGESGEVTMVFRSMSLPTTMEQLAVSYPNFDDVPASLDSLIWTGGRAYLAGLDPIGRVYSMSGTPLPASIVTGEMELAQFVKQIDQRAVGERVLVRAIRPQVYVGGNATLRARVLSRNTLQEATQASAFSSLTQRGECPQRVDSRYQRIELSMSGDWQQALAVQADAVCTGAR